MSKSKVSVIIPVYNRTEFLFQAIQSVLRQSYPDWECIVVDDGSPEEAAQQIRDWISSAKDERIRYLAQPHKGVGLARNAGLQFARGEFIQYLDSDDFLHPNKLETQLSQLKAHPEAGLSYCITVSFSNVPFDIALPSNRTAEGFSNLLPHILEKRIWNTLSPLWRKTACDRIGGWLDYLHYEDWEYECRAAIRGIRAVHCPEVLCCVRRHQESRISLNAEAWQLARSIEGTTDNVLSELAYAGLVTKENTVPLARRFLTAARKYYELGYSDLGYNCFNKAQKFGDRSLQRQAKLIRASIILFGPKRGVRWLEQINSFLRHGSSEECKKIPNSSSTDDCF